MSPVFRHGRLRLYLLKLLDEAPRHGYEVIRLLQDRFMGVYAPSPGTIYPRLARLEEEGLVTHDEVDGKKVYRITDKGREEIRGRLDDLADLEEEITESVRDIAREVTEDVRDTVRNLREELTAASREVRDGRERARDAAREQARRARDEVRDSARQARDELHGESSVTSGGSPRDQAGDPAGGVAEGTRRAGRPAQSGDGTETAGGTGGRDGGTGGYGRGAGGRGGRESAGSRARAGGGRDRPGGEERGERPGWQEWPGWTGWASRTGWRGWPDAAGRPGRAGRPGTGRPGTGQPGTGQPGTGQPGTGRSGTDRPGAGRPDAGMFRDLERMGLDFARELMAASWRTDAFGADALTDLRVILEDTLTRIKDEVFGTAGPWSAETDKEGASPADGKSGESGAGPGGEGGEAGAEDETGGSASTEGN
jgi:DNA-binding PadR family transcriptional regulator